MKCHYEILGVSRDVDDNEIKTAYRKLALRWHPDKNLDDPEEATEQFQLVQQAYEVLSDPHERAWYDNHREQILRGKNSDYQENCLDLFQYFTVSCFKGYGDDPGGFYHVYGDVFEKIAAEDAEFMEDEEEISNIPKFGKSQASYEEVVGQFYAYWQSYCTKKSYAWLCPYNINEIKDRRILREIEKDMKKVVQKARKERNEEVRNLVSFVRKRDKRVQAYKKLLEDRAALNRQKQEQIRLEQLLKRKKEIEELQKTPVNSAMNDLYEQQLRQLEQEYDSEDENDFTDDASENHNIDREDECNAYSSADDNFEISLFCGACDKVFSNENAYLNHQSSKKHKINVEIIKESFREEKETLDEENKETELADDANIDLEEEKENDEEEIKVPKQKSKKNKKSKKSQLGINEEDTNELPDLLEDIEIEQTDWDDSTKSKKKQKSKKMVQKKNGIVQPGTPKGNVSNETPRPVSEKSEKIEAPQTDVIHSCVTCKAIFESKNKLFSHLKKTDHGVYIPKKNSTPVAATTQNEKTKKGKRNK